jgi:hypothetical protein
MEHETSNKNRKGKKVLRKSLEEQQLHLLENLTDLTNRLISTIKCTIDTIPPKEALEMILKLIEKAKKIGLPILDEQQPGKLATLSSSELEIILKNYINKANTDDNRE